MSIMTGWLPSLRRRHKECLAAEQSGQHRAELCQVTLRPTVQALEKAAAAGISIRAPFSPLPFPSGLPLPDLQPNSQLHMSASCDWLDSSPQGSLGV